MLPRRVMVTNKQRLGHGLKLVLLMLGLIWVAGCTPPGPRALLDGKRLIEKGRYAQAVDRLKVATSYLSTNAQAWNYLGLAYHHSGQAVNAQEAYLRALKLNHDLISVHYNYGCLLLEQNNVDAARNELTAFVLHQGNSPEGWVKLGVAQMRLRELGTAERSFNESLRLNPQNPEALNNLGMIQMQRGRPHDAIFEFNAALKQQPDYPPALLNLALVSQTFSNTKSLALQKYREYLALKPKPANWDAVSVVARQLEQELTPPAVARNAVTNRPVAARPGTNNVVRVATAVPTNPPKVDVVVNTPAVPVAEVPKPAVSPDLTIKPEVVNLADTPAIKPAEVVVNQPVQPEPDSTPTAEPEDKPQPPPSHRAGKPGFLRGIFHRERKADKTPVPTEVTVEPEAAKVQPAYAKPMTVPKFESPPAHRPTPAPAPVMPARYNFRSPAKPASGNRAEAERLYAQGTDAQQDRRTQDALTAFRAATQADQSYFEAHCSLGLIAYETGDMAQCLSAYETALAIVPESFTARFNFSLALKKAGYLVDSARELESLLLINPNDSPAHLAAAHLILANLYSEQFHQPQAARPHYAKVLELDPHNAQATAIRFWLQDHP